MQMQMQNAIQSMPEKSRRWASEEEDKVRSGRIVRPRL